MGLSEYITLSIDEKSREYGQAVIKAVQKTYTIEKKCRELTKEIDEAKE